MCQSSNIELEGKSDSNALLEREIEIPAEDFETAGEATLQLRTLLREADVPQVALKRAMIACFEAEMNVVMHSCGGVMRVRVYKDRIRVEVEDTGAGIADVDSAMTEGFSTASEAGRERGFGAGMGLPNIQENTDRLSVMSSPGEGTVLWFDVLFKTKETKEQPEKQR